MPSEPTPSPRRIKVRANPSIRQSGIDDYDEAIRLGKHRFFRGLTKRILRGEERERGTGNPPREPLSKEEQLWLKTTIARRAGSREGQLLSRLLEILSEKENKGLPF